MEMEFEDGNDLRPPKDSLVDFASKWRPNSHLRYVVGFDLNGPYAGMMGMYQKQEDLKSDRFWWKLLPPAGSSTQEGSISWDASKRTYVIERQGPAGDVTQFACVLQETPDGDSASIQQAVASGKVVVRGCLNLYPPRQLIEVYGNDVRAVCAVIWQGCLRGNPEKAAFGLFNRLMSARESPDLADVPDEVTRDFDAQRELIFRVFLALRSEEGEYIYRSHYISLMEWFFQTLPEVPLVLKMYRIFRLLQDEDMPFVGAPVATSMLGLRRHWEVLCGWDEPGRFCLRLSTTPGNLTADYTCIGIARMAVAAAAASASAGSATDKGGDGDTAGASGGTGSGGGGGSGGGSSGAAASEAAESGGGAAASGNAADKDNSPSVAAARMSDGGKGSKASEAGAGDGASGHEGPSNKGSTSGDSAASGGGNASEKADDSAVGGKDKLGAAARSSEAGAAGAAENDPGGTGKNGKASSTPGEAAGGASGKSGNGGDTISSNLDGAGGKKSPDGGMGGSTVTGAPSARVHVSVQSQQIVVARVMPNEVILRVDAPPRGPPRTTNGTGAAAVAVAAAVATAAGDDAQAGRQGRRGSSGGAGGGNSGGGGSAAVGENVAMTAVAAGGGVAAAQSQTFEASSVGQVLALWPERFVMRCLTTNAIETYLLKGAATS
ncbi:unnamed protein product [Phaeothamnion confervicola]